MTISTILVALLGGRLSIYERVTLQEALNVDTREGLVQFAGSVLKMTLFFELIGTDILAIRWSPEVCFGYSTYLAAFHSISAFNNAGFSLFSTNLVAYRGDLTVNLVITSLIIIGGSGFFVLRELRQGRSFRKLSLHTRLALTITAVLIVGGTGLFYFLERSNPQTFGSLSRGEALLAAYFQAITPRTAGFNTIDLGLMTRPALFLTMILMFTGASPGGTGGGVKATTFGVTGLALWATVRGETEPVAFGRRIPADVVARAFFISLLAFVAERSGETEHTNVSPGADEVIQAGDVLSLLGNNERLAHLDRLLEK